MAHKMMTIDGTEYTLVPKEVTLNKSEKKCKSDSEVEPMPKKVSAYNMYVKDQRADVTEKLTEVLMSKPSNEQVMQAIALRWSNLKDGAKKGDKDSVAEMLQYTTLANEASATVNEKKKRKKKDSDTASVVSLASNDSDDWYVHTPWYKRRIQTTDWRPGNPGRPPNWFIAGINGVDVKTVKKHNRMKKLMQKTPPAHAQVEDVDEDESGSESD